MYLNWVTICLSIKHRSKLNFLILFLEISKFVWGKMDIGQMDSKSVVLKQGAYMLNDQNYYENVLNMKTRIFEIEVIRPIYIFVVSIDAPSSGNTNIWKQVAFSSLQQKYQRKYCLEQLEVSESRRLRTTALNLMEKVDHIYIHAFSKRFYPKRLSAFRLHIFCQCVPWELNPLPFALLTQCSNHWATGSPINNFNDQSFGLFFFGYFISTLKGLKCIDSCTSLKLNMIMEDILYVTIFQHQD